MELTLQLQKLEEDISPKVVSHKTTFKWVEILEMQLTYTGFKRKIIFKTVFSQR